jgi:hypothetical protein
VACPAKLHEPPDKQAPNFDPACAEVAQLVLSPTTDLRPISAAAKNTTREPVFALADPLQKQAASTNNFTLLLYPCITLVHDCYQNFGNLLSRTVMPVELPFVMLPTLHLKLRA